MDICFIRNNWNYYSLATIFASIEDLDYVNPFFVNISDLKNSSFTDGTIFCFSLNSIYYNKNKDNIISIIRFLKKKGNYFFIAGGPHCQYKPDLLLEDGFDIVVVGSGEKSIRTIISDIKEKKDLKKIYQEEVTNLNDYKPFPVKFFHYKPIEITRGCPHRCYFCQTSYLHSHNPIERTIENIVKYVKIAFERNIKDFRFITPNAFSYGNSINTNSMCAIQELLSSIRSIIKDNGRIFFGTFPSEVRPDYVTTDLLIMLKKYVNNKRIIIGAQSGSDRILENSNRGHNVKTIERAIDTAIQTGFAVDVDIIIGMPDENEEDTKETFNLIHRYMKKPVRFHLHYFMPLPGTPWRDKKPATLSKKFIEEIEYLTGRGVIWGNWRNQRMAVAKEY
ncbi:MAG: TIGR04013 family B12-binding domain/radical SAM domain-containing protein [Proteobacteria bacterium]|nr:TIGR04013 family B12-binding domain/radical SAM domain-containing protein [Pseudomonadota bacterium]